MPALRELYRRPECARLFGTALEAVQTALDQVGEASYGGHLPNGLPLREWLSGRAEPAPDELSHSLVDGICVLVWQLSLLQPHRRGSGPPHLSAPSARVLGYSLGLFAAAVAGMRIEDRHEFLRVSHESLLIASLILLRCHEYTDVTRCEPDTVKRYLTRFPASAAPTPMAAILGIDVDALKDAVAMDGERSGDPVELGIINSPRSAVLVGSAEALAGFRFRNNEFLSSQRARWSFLACRAPFHGRMLSPVVERMEADWAKVAFDVTGDQLSLPVWGSGTLQNLQESRSVRQDFLENVICRPLDWPAIVREAVGIAPPDQVFDYGPGLGARLFTRECLNALGYESTFATVRAE